MIFTLADAKEFCAKYVADGRAEDDTLVLDTINEAMMILVNEGDWKNTVRTMRFNVTNNSFSMPNEVETILQVAFDSTPANVRSRAYEYLEGGPGVLNCSNTIAQQDIVDMGDGFPTFWPIGGTLRNLIAISDSMDDNGKTMRVQGYTSYKNKVLPTAPGEDVPIMNWRGGEEGRLNSVAMVYSEQQYIEISSIVKPVTAGYISLYAIDTDTNNMWVLGKYHPDETQPSYRRYKITGRFSYTQIDCITCRVKLRYVPLKYDQDVLLIQNLPALRAMCQSIHQRNLGNVQDALLRQGDATRMLDKQLENVRLPNHDYNVIMHLSMGDIPEMQ